MTQTPTLIESVAAPAAPIIVSGSKYMWGFACASASGVNSGVQTESGSQPIR